MVLVMVFAVMPITSWAQPSDLAGHWAGNVISEWMSKGLVSGYPDGSFKPEATMTRAEFMTIVNKVYNFTSEKDISFTDVKASDWYYGIVRKAIAAGYITGYPDGTLQPNQPIQRQEVASIFCKLESLDQAPAVAEQFKDISPSSWAKGYIGAVVKAGYFAGYGDGTFRETASIKRAEAVAATNNLDIGRAVTYNTAGTFGPATGTETINKSVVVKADGVTLQNITINGNLTIAESVGQGTVTLNNVTVTGETYIKGGGPDSIKINGGSFGKVLMLKISNDSIRILAIGVKNLQVEVSPLSQGGQIIFEGAFKSIVVLASEMKIKTQGNTTIEQFTVSETAQGSTVALSIGTTIDLVKINVIVTFSGQGRILAVEITVTGSTFERLPDKITNMITKVIIINVADPTTPTTPGNSGNNNVNDDEELPVAAVPTADITGGYVVKGTLVTLTSATSGAAIYYTLNGSTPTAASTLYTAPFAVNGNVTVKAIAAKANYTTSAVLTVAYYTQPTIADVVITSGSAIFNFGFYGDSAKAVSIPYATALSDPNIGLSTTRSSVTLALVSGSSVTTTAAVNFDNLGINVSSGSATFTSSGALIAAFGSFASFTGVPNHIYLHLEFNGTGMSDIDVDITLEAGEINIITSVFPIASNAPTFNYYLARAGTSNLQ